LHDTGNQSNDYRCSANDFHTRLNKMPMGVPTLFRLGVSTWPTSASGHYWITTASEPDHDPNRRVQNCRQDDHRAEQHRDGRPAYKLGWIGARSTCHRCKPSGARRSNSLTGCNQRCNRCADRRWIRTRAPAGRSRSGLGAVDRARSAYPKGARNGERGCCSVTALWRRS
jgi:hypothetical protein